ncbi:MAG: XRE family transcriptional regulator [Caulobacteraceae bacterium]|nr:XRE family transcriptional regulator [Caulobacteraceae bacterium]
MHAKKGPCAIAPGMSSEIIQRLAEVIAADPRSKRQISMAAGLGQNYVQQILSGERDPTITRVAAVLNVLGSASILYVISGVKIGPEEEEFLRVALMLPPDLRRDAMSLLKSIAEREAQQSQQADRTVTSDEMHQEDQ